MIIAVLAKIVILMSVLGPAPLANSVRILIDSFNDSKKGPLEFQSIIFLAQVDLCHPTRLFLPIIYANAAWKRVVNICCILNQTLIDWLLTRFRELWHPRISIQHKFEGSVPVCYL